MHVAPRRMSILAGMDIHPAFRTPESLVDALDDAALAEQRPAVRALLVKRMEDLWLVTCDELESGKDRVRWAELQIRIADRLAKWYRLDVPVPGEPEPDDPGLERLRLRESVASTLDDLASRAGQDL